jgi:hypothetical protein
MVVLVVICLSVGRRYGDGGIIVYSFVVYNVGKVEYVLFVVHKNGTYEE